MNPDTLPSVNSSASAHGILVYKYNASESTANVETVYSLYHISNAVFLGNEYNIKVTHSTNQWADNGNDWPDDPLTVNGANIECWNASTLQYVFQKPTVADWISSGPTVSSITIANQIASTRQFTVQHTGTLSASDITYTLDNGYDAPVDIQTLASPNAGVSNIQTTSTGSTFDSYLVASNGLHSVTIDSTIITFVVDGTVLNTTATNPITSTTVITPNDSSANTITLYDRAADGKFLGYENSIGHHFNIRLKPSNKARLEVYLRNVADTHFNDVAYSPLFTIGNQETMTFNYSPYGYDWGFSVLDWAYSASESETSEDDEDEAPVSTTSDGGGKPRRYPIISTNLFDRQRSIFSIGLTHKDETLF